jgi:hypothetical protein
MALQKTAVIRVWLSSDHVVTQHMKAITALQQKNGVFYAVHAEML